MKRAFIEAAAEKAAGAAAAAAENVFKKAKNSAKGAASHSHSGASKFTKSGRKYTPYGGMVELKYNLTTWIGTGVNTSGYMLLLNGIAQGDDNTARDGRQIKCEYIEGNVFIYHEDLTTGSMSNRMMLVWDKSPNSTSPTAATMIPEILGAAIGSSSILAPVPAVDQQDRYEILFDTFKVLGEVSNVATQALAIGQGPQIIKIKKKINRYTQYSGTGATAGSIAQGALYWVQVGNQPTGSAALSNGWLRLRFTEE